MAGTGITSKGDVLSPQQAIEVVSVKWTSNGTGAVATATVVGRVGVVTRVTTGLYSIKLSSGYKTLLGFAPGFGNVARDDLSLIEDTANTNIANGNIRAICYQEGNGVIDPPANTIVYLTLTVGTFNTTQGA